MRQFDFSCCICHKDAGTTYMVHDELWRKVSGIHHDKLICWNCFEKLLGRNIISSDLKQDVCCNQLIIKLLKKLEMSNKGELIL